MALLVLTSLIDPDIIQAKTERNRRVGFGPDRYQHGLFCNADRGDEDPLARHGAAHLLLLNMAVARALALKRRFRPLRFFTAEAGRELLVRFGVRGNRDWSNVWPRARKP